MVIATNLLQNKIILGTIFNPFIGMHFLISCSILHIKPYIYMASWILPNFFSSFIFCCFIFVFVAIVAAITLFCVCVWFRKEGFVHLAVQCNTILRFVLYFLSYLLIHLKTLIIVVVYQNWNTCCSQTFLYSSHLFLVIWRKCSCTFIQV